MSLSKANAATIGQGFVSDEPAAHLSVRSADQIGVAPDNSSQLLLGFEFGSHRSTDQRAGVVNLALEPLTAGSATESWWYKGQVEHRQVGPVRLAECAHYSALIIEWEESRKGNFKALSQEAYTHLLSALNSAKHKRPIRLWNYFDGINTDQNQQERYQSFSSGRAAAFAQFGIGDAFAPVGTAIGTSGSNSITLIALASDLPFEVMENPRQVSAYHYPIDYGPDSPKFSRAGLLAQSEGDLFLVSGTAAVVGHGSAFPFDTARQLDETLTNLEVVTRIGGRIESVEGKFMPGPGAVIRVYLRNATDYPDVVRALRDGWGELPKNNIFLEGAICRRELMVEMEAVLPVQISDNIVNWN